MLTKYPNVITHDEGIALRKRASLNEQWREQFRKPNGWIVINPDEAKTCPVDARMENADYSTLEVFEWHADPPDTYFCYPYKDTDGSVWAATWMGDALSTGPLILGVAFTGNLGGARQSVRFSGTNGCDYYGWRYIGNGDFLRVKRKKKSTKF
jgi:hypothetical protein